MLGHWIPRSNEIKCTASEGECLMCALQKQKECYVEIVTFGEETVVSRMGPMNRRRAERVDDGVNINLDHENFFTRIVEEE